MEFMMSLLILLVLVFTVSFSEANYDFLIRFYEFRNPLGLQCGECESGGPPACCDDVQRNESCINVAPRTCDTRFRFLLKQFGASVETTPITGKFPYFTPSSGGNSDTFNVGPGGFFAASNPFIISSTSEWTGRTQFFIDALDRAVHSNETEVFINRFSIDLELELGADFTERIAYTGIYNISGLGFDMSFKVQCSVNYYGPNCKTLCEPMEGVYTCDSEGNSICEQSYRDPATQCTTCLQELFYDIQTNCTQCLPGRDITSNCTICLPGYDPSTNCTQCLPGRDESTNCTTCLLDYDPSTECFPNGQCQPTPTTSTATTTSRTAALAILGGVVGLSVIINVILIIVVVVVVTKKRETLQQSPIQINDREGAKEAMDIEMKPNSLYGLTSGSESIVTKPNEVYGVSVPAQTSHLATYEYVNPQ